MQVQNYLKQFGVEKLKEEFSIKVKEYPEEGIMVLNYDQIFSPKSHPIVVECRGLILDTNFEVVSRSYDRFFNIGEVPESQAHIDWSVATLHEKIDGSIIRTYFYNNKWEIATRGLAFAEGTIFDSNTTFRSLVLKALQMNEEEFQVKAKQCLDPDISYILEVTAMENRCVKRYDGYTLHYLSARNSKTFAYEYEDGLSHMLTLSDLVSVPKKYTFDSVESCKIAASELKDLDEGYVLYQDNIPVCKIKSPAYVAIHAIKGEGLSPKRIAELVITGEQEEYLSYFEEDRKYITPYVEVEQTLLNTMDEQFFARSSIENQKDFALAVATVPNKSILFTMRKTKQSSREVWKSMSKELKVKTLMELVL